MQKSVKVSIVIPCFNTPEEYITRALESVRSQSFRDFEVIVVDDGSDTAHSEVLARVCQPDTDIRLIRIPNSGVSSARNAGMKAARGEYLAFLDSDDVLAADFLERALHAAEETETDFIVGGLQETEEADVPYCPHRTGKPYYRICSGENLQQTAGLFLIGLRSRIAFPGGYIGRGPYSRLVRTELAQRVPFDPELTIGEDLIWNLQILKESESVCFVRESWYAYRQNPHSAVHRYEPGLKEEYRKQIEKLTGLIDLTDDEMYAAYTDQIYEGLRLLWFRYLSSEKKDNPKNYRKAVREIYTERPWTEIGTERYFSQVGSIKKITAILYRYGLFYTAMAWKEKVKPTDVCGGRKDDP